MKIALVLNRLAPAPTAEEQDINVERRARHIRILAETIRSSGHEALHIEDDDRLRENLVAFGPNLVFLQTFRADPGASILAIQTLLSAMNLPYTGSPPDACRMGQNKFLAKEAFRWAGLPTPAYRKVETNEALKEKPDNLNYPLFIKPLYGGCSMGIHPDNPVRDDDEFARVLAETLVRARQPALVEEFVEGREFTVGLLGNQAPTALPLIEFVDLVRKDNPLVFRLFDAKTDAESPESLVCPAEIPSALNAQIQGLAVAAFQALGCQDYARVDMRCDQRGNPYILEVNVHPSLLPTSSLPIMAGQAGIAYARLLEHIFQSALSRHQAYAD